MEMHALLASVGGIQRMIVLDAEKMLIIIEGGMEMAASADDR